MRRSRQEEEGEDEMGSRPLIPAAAAVLWVNVTSVGLWKRLGITSPLDLLQEC